MQAFSFSAQFAHESAMLKLPKERRRWGESKGAGGWGGGGEAGRENLRWPKGLYLKLNFSQAF